MDHDANIAPQKATRDAAEARLAAFVPHMGRRYAAGRNHDRGPGQHHAVSGLSPYLRRRLVLEQDAVGTALAAHGPENAAKFVQEVVWRSYFKGWLERRPQIWHAYRDGRDADLVRCEDDRALRRALAQAEAGQTGIACFDAWVQELVETGYLHNHARMWFASIWIFTLRLPWRLGADVFLRHLLDGDPASNTLGWRWVAGLHTRGKAYAARADNIERFTGGRFRPRPDELEEVVEPLTDEEPDGLPPLQPLRNPAPPEPGLPTALLITEEDCRAEDFGLAALDLRAVATLATSQLRSPRPVAPAVAAFDAAALSDAAGRVRAATGLPAQALQAGAARDLADWAAEAGAQQIVTPYMPEGPARDWMRDAEPALSARGIGLCEWRRDWDSTLWPHATGGFFKLRERLPRLLDSLGIG